MKFNTRLILARFFGQSLATHIIKMKTELPECIIPVPLHSSRLGQRGYNQSLELARHLSCFLRLPLNRDSLRRVRNTQAQSELPASKRKRNIRGAFTVNGQSLAGADHVAIIDDVITTGSTANEVARQLKKAGVKRIDVWACARAVI